MNQKPNTTVLLIEDDPAFAEVLRVVFSRQQCRAILAPTMQQALTALSAPETPELVIVDLMLPDSNPNNTIAKIDELRARASNAIILVLSGVLPEGAKLPQGTPVLRKSDAGLVDKLVAIASSFSSGLGNTSARLREIERLTAPA